MHVCLQQEAAAALLFAFAYGPSRRSRWSGEDWRAGVHESLLQPGKLYTWMPEGELLPTCLAQNSDCESK
jgi:hypothetical protein